MNPCWKKIILSFGIGLVVFSFMVLGIYRFLLPPVGRTNILVLGAVGEGYAGGDLTDTIIFLSVDNQAGRVLMLSLPRDIWIAPLRTKLNSVYHYEGMGKTKEAVSEIIGQPINYGILIDSNLFTKIVDALGGIEVEVERSFDDYKYPIAGKENDECEGDPEYKCRYEHIHFEVGKQLMDGTTALKYVRSRYAEGEEGTDFARSQRQQRLLLAVKNKIFSPHFFLDPRQTFRLFKIITSNIQTDISKEKYIDFLKIALRFRPKNLKTEVLNENYLIQPPPSKEKYDNQWVLVPKTENWEEIQSYVASLIGKF